MDKPRIERAVKEILLAIGRTLVGRACEKRPAGSLKPTRCSSPGWRRTPSGTWRWASRKTTARWS